jgi:hypothetical protein
LQGRVSQPRQTEQRASAHHWHIVQSGQGCFLGPARTAVLRDGNSIANFVVDFVDKVYDKAEVSV